MDNYDDAVSAASTQYGVNPAVLKGLLYQESRFNPEAYNDKSGATGIAQFMPATAKELGVDPDNPVESIFGAAYYLKKNIDQFGSVSAGLAAYNHGPGNVKRLMDTHGDDWIDHLPDETSDYLSKIAMHAQKYGAEAPQLAAVPPSDDVRHIATDADTPLPTGEMALNPLLAKAGAEMVQGPSRPGPTIQRSNEMRLAEMSTPEKVADAQAGAARTDALPATRPKTPDELIEELARMDPAERAARIVSGLGPGVAEAAVAMSAQIPQMAAQFAGFLKASANAESGAENYAKRTAEITPEWVKKLAAAEVLQPETYVGQLATHGVGEAFHFIGDQPANIGAGMAAVGTVAAGGDRQAAQEAYESKRDEIKQYTQELTNAALIGQMGKHAVEARLPVGDRQIAKAMDADIAGAQFDPASADAIAREAMSPDNAQMSLQRPVTVPNTVADAPDLDTAIAAARAHVDSTPLKGESNVYHPDVDLTPPPAPVELPKVIDEHQQAINDAFPISARETGIGSHNGAPIEAVAEDRMPAAASLEAAGKVTREGAGALRDLYGAAGTDVTFYKDHAKLPDGFQDPNNPARIFLSDNPSKAAPFVAMHEFGHTLEQVVTPDGKNLHNVLMEAVSRGMNAAGRAYAEKRFGDTLPDNATEAQKSAHYSNEMSKDILGWAGQKQSFWTGVFDHIQTKYGDRVATDVLAKMIDGVQAALDKVRALFGPKLKDKANEYVNNLNEIHGVLTEMVGNRFGEEFVRRARAAEEMRARPKPKAELWPKEKEDLLNQKLAEGRTDERAAGEADDLIQEKLASMGKTGEVKFSSKELSDSDREILKTGGIREDTIKSLSPENKKLLEKVVSTYENLPHGMDENVAWRGGYAAAHTRAVNEFKKATGLDAAPLVVFMQRSGKFENYADLKNTVLKKRFSDTRTTNPDIAGNASDRSTGLEQSYGKIKVPLDASMSMISRADTSSVKPSDNRGLTNSKNFSNKRDSKSEFEHRDNILQRPGKSSKLMEDDVISLAHDLQVGNRVVKPISVDVMHDLGLSKSSTDMPLHSESMLKSLPTDAIDINTNESVKSGVKFSDVPTSRRSPQDISPNSEIEPENNLNPNVRQTTLEIETGEKTDKQIAGIWQRLKQLGDDVVSHRYADGVLHVDVKDGAAKDAVEKQLSGRYAVKTAEDRVIDEAVRLSPKQTESPEFRKWFKDSKVVDDAGEPEVVYHGTDRAFNKFSFKNSGQKIIWFTNDKSAIDAGEIGAAGRGKTMDLYASIQNPAGWPEYHRYGLGELQREGYDGAILREKDGTYSGFVFDSNQLKSASKNKGTFDATNPDIRYSPKSPGFEKWFEKSKVVDNEGDPKIVYHGTLADFNQFDYGTITSFNEGVGFYFTDNKDVANGYGESKHVYLSIQKPLPYDQKNFSPSVIRKIVQRIAESEAKKNDADIADGFLSNFGDVRTDGFTSVVNEAVHLLKGDATANDFIGGLFNAGVNARTLLQSVKDVTGYDGIIADGFSNSKVGDNHIYVAWFPEQIKYATNNNGEFSVTNPDIRFSPKSRLIDSTKDFSKNIVDDLFMKVAPMSVGSDAARALAKDFANQERKARWQGAEFDNMLKKDFTREQRQRMWEAADEENDLRREGNTSQTKGLNSLPPDQRQVLDSMHDYGNKLLDEAIDNGLFKGPSTVHYWAPRVAAQIGEDGAISKPSSGGGQGGNEGRNITTSASSLQHRKYETTAESEAALQARFGDTANYVKDIRVMPMAMARLERAVAGRELVNQIKDLGRATGEELISSTEKPGFITIDNPAFKTFTPRMIENAEGKRVPVMDTEGNIVFDKVPIYIRADYEGPLRSIMSTDMGAINKAFMDLKAKTMGLIMYSPLIHNAVEWGRALPAMPGKVATFKIYFEGNAAKHDPMQMRQAIDDGMVPIGQRAGIQDITGIADVDGLAPGRSWTAQALAYPVGKVSKAAGEAVKRAVDAAGDFWHGTLLWDRIGDLQMGLYTNIKADYTKVLEKKGLNAGDAEATAGKLAAHMANRYAGALPNEAMSYNAKMLANWTLFSRTFTLGNLGVMKDIFTGLPKDVQAQVKRDSGEVANEMLKSAAKRKAIQAFALDIALMVTLNSVLQDALDVMKRGKSLDDVERGYVDRLQAMIKRVRENPMELTSPFDQLLSLTSNWENEPGKQERIHYANDEAGTATYLRLPTGKIGEEFKGWLTSPLEMLKRKEGTIARPLIQTFITNDKGFGRRVYDPDAKGLKGTAESVGRVVWNLLSQQVPADALQSLGDITRGAGTDLDKAKVLGPIAGLTFSKGAPGGPAVGELYAEENRRRGAKADVMEEVRHQLKLGNIDKADDLMADAGMTRSEINGVMKSFDNPGRALSPQRLRKFNQTAPDEKRDRMQRARGE